MRATALERFLPRAEVRERHEIAVRAPAALVYEVATSFDLQSIPVVNVIFRMREWLMRTTARPAARLRLDVRGLQDIGWGTLVEQPGRLFAAGAACRPWQRDVVFTPLDEAAFAAWSAPDTVRIAWTIEVEPVAGTTSRLATETRVQASDADAQRKFRPYGSGARHGIVAIRWLLLRGIKREAERTFHQRMGRQG